MLLLIAPPARAVEDGTPYDRGRFIVFEGGEPVATERFAYTNAGDSLVIEAVHSRRMRGADGEVKDFKKSMGLIVGRLDHGLIRYLSNQDMGGKLSVFGTSMAPDDTVITVFREVDGDGNAEALRLAPGRVFVLDPLIFTCFDVICRSIGSQTFTSRPVSLVTLGDPPRAIEATVTRTPGDTLRWGGKPVVTTRLTFKDQAATFRAWVDRSGQMLRFETGDGRVRVEREAPPVPPRNRRPRR